MNNNETTTKKGILTQEILDNAIEYCENNLDGEFSDHADLVKYFIIDYSILEVGDSLQETKDMDFWNDQNGRGDYPCDSASEFADSSVSIYCSDLWKNAYYYKEYIEDAISEGLVDFSSKDFTLEKAFQAGEYVYYQRLAYDVLDNLKKFFEELEIKDTDTEESDEEND